MSILERDLTALENAITQLRTDHSTLRRTLWTLIAWMAQSANSPIRRDEAETLLRDLEKETR